MKIYKSDQWFYNMGIVGFDRVLKYNKDYYELDLEDYNYIINEDSIEFDINLLESFHIYFFRYFLDRYNSAEDQEKKIRVYLTNCEIKDRFKDNLKYIKEVIKKNNDKIKKLEISEYEECEDIYKKLGNIKNQEEFLEYKPNIERYIEILKLETINSRITLNKFKAILSNNFFGQVSFLNVSHTSKTLEEQQEILSKDYVAPILKLYELKETISEKNEEGLRKFINGKIEILASKEDEVDKLIKGINRNLFGKKKKVESIDVLLDSYNTCYMCDENISIGGNYSEGNFIPLAISNDNSSNMYWNFNAAYPICPVCKLILLCSAAGVTEIFKGYMEDKYSYNDKLYYGFINIEGTLKTLIDQNNNFRYRSDRNVSFESYILDSISQSNKISQWQLENILYVEFNTDYGSRNTKMNYFNIPKYLAEFLKKDHEIIQRIKDNKLRMEIFDTVLARKDIKNIIWCKIRENLASENNYIINILPIIRVRSYLKRYKEGINMADKSFEKKLNFIYAKGCTIAKILRVNNQDNKIQGLVYRLLNAAKARNKSEFMDTIIRIFMSVGEEVPVLFLQVLKEDELDFEEVAHSFIAGLTSKEEYVNGEVNKEGK